MFLLGRRTTKVM